MKNCAGILMVEFIDCLWQKDHIYYDKFIDLWAWEIFPPSDIFSNFSLQSSCQIVLWLAWLDLHKIFYIVFGYFEGCCFTDFFLSSFIICIQEGYWFFKKLMLWLVTSLKVLINCRSSLVVFLASLKYTLLYHFICK